MRTNDLKEDLEIVFKGHPLLEKVYGLYRVNWLPRNNRSTFKYKKEVYIILSGKSLLLFLWDFRHCDTNSALSLSSRVSLDEFVDYFFKFGLSIEPPLTPDCCFFALVHPADVDFAREVVTWDTVYINELDLFPNSLRKAICSVLVGSHFTVLYNDLGSPSKHLFIIPALTTITWISLLEREDTISIVYLREVYRKNTLLNWTNCSSFF